MDPIFGGLLGAGMSLFGNMFSNNNNQAMMQQQQAFQEKMSSTAYQRAYKDMTAAGLNPMMMFSSGSAASTPPGASPVAQQPAGSLSVDAMQKALSTATQMRVADATINNLVEQNAKIKAETLTERERPALVGQQVLLTADQASKVATETNTLREALPIVVNDALRSKNEHEFRKTRAGKLLDQSGLAGRKAADTLSPVTNVISSAKGVKSLFSDRYGSW